MRSTKDKNKSFPGFPSEPATNYWPYPKTLNGWWHILTGSEQKSLDYILRHTWGYSKTTDIISYSQFLGGIIKRDGTIIDKGCGIKSSATLRKALRGLEEMGFIECTRFNGKAVWYKLKFLNGDMSESKQPLQKLKNTSLEIEEVTSLESKDTIIDSTIKDNNNGEINSPAREMFSFFTSQAKEIVGIDPEINYARDGGLIKLRLKKYTPDQIKDLIVWYLGSQDCERLGASLSVALSTNIINKWLYEH